MNTCLSLLCRLLLCLILLALTVGFFIASTPGLNSVASLANALVPGELHLTGASGQLLKTVSFKTLHYTHKGVVLQLNEGLLAWTSPAHQCLRVSASHVTLNGVDLGQLEGTITTHGDIQITQGWKNSRWPMDQTHVLTSASGQIIIEGHWPNDLKLNAEAWLMEPQKTRLMATGTLHDQQLSGTLTVTVPSLDFINSLINLNQHIQVLGELKATISIQGPLTQPEVTGKLSLNNSQVTLPQLGLTLKPSHATLETHHTHWKAQALFSSPSPNAGALTLTGQGEFSPNFTGELTLRGGTLPLVNTSEYTIQAAPDLIFSFKPNDYRLNGRINIPEASIKPMTFSDTISLTDDAVFVSDQSNAPPLNITTDIQIIMGKSVALDVKGLHGLLDGSIHLTQQPKQPPQATGVLTLLDGRYKAYGQHLVIQESQLSFTGTAITNPTIHLRAIRHVDQHSAATTGASQLFDFTSQNLQNNIAYGTNVRVGIDIQGRLKHPKVSLFSNPPTLSQADILSMLLLGKPANQASKSGGLLLISAMQGLNLDSSSKGAALLQQLKNRLNVDVDLQNNTRTTQANSLTQGTAIGVGKSITERMYLHYTIDLFQDNSNVLTLTYLLNQFFSIQVTANNIGNGIDILYTHQGETE
jgi:translocation and assembly module TamB